MRNKTKKFCSLEEAKKYVQGLGIKTQREWQEWIKTNERPGEIPADPPTIYAEEWTSWGDFFGTNSIASYNREFRSFKEIKKYVQELGIKTKEEFFTWTKSGNRPRDIPTNPVRTYKNEWISWGDFLGTNSIASFNRTFLSFEETKKYIQQFGIKSQIEWGKWAKTNKRPKDIPANPREVYKKEWVGWGDFLGTNSIANQNREFRSFEEVKKYAQGLGIKTWEEWRKWAKTNKRPKDIPIALYRTYKKEWVSWGDFIGTDYIAPQKREFRTYTEVKKYVQNLEIKTSEDWKKWAKTAKRPKDIPAKPYRTYKNEWISWGDFLGTNSIANFNRTFLSFEEAKKYVQQIGIKTKEGFTTWAKSDIRPQDIPTDPARTYKKEWISWGDFLGTNSIASFNRTFLSFEEAKKYVQGLGIKTKDEWQKWTKTSQRPKNIPSAPDRTYKKEWMGWGDFFGYTHYWTPDAIKKFVKSLLPYVDGFSQADMYVLLSQSGILDLNWYNKGKSFVKALKSGRFPKEELEKFVSDQNSLVDDFFLNPTLSIEAIDENLQSPKNRLDDNIIEDDLQELPVISTRETLAALDSKLVSTADQEALDYFIKSATAKIWKHTFHDKDNALLQIEEYKENGEYSKEVKKLFLKDYNGAIKLKIPSGYSFEHKPNLMQRYTAYLVKDRKRLGNWSGTGAGKTLSAILASRVIDAKLTVVCCPNSVVKNWKKNILATYKNSTIICKDDDWEQLKNKESKYLILNYEFFQQPQVDSKLQKLLDNGLIDFIIIDEIHYSKQRTIEKISKRKQNISILLSEAAIRNKKLHVLGMSATPVINNLFEGKTLIEMVTGVSHDDLQTKATVNNCISHYQKIVSHGIRWMPSYDYKLNLITEPIECDSFIPEIKDSTLRRESVIGLEAILTRAKLAYIIDNLRPKTIIYTHYLKNILNILKEEIERQNWKVAIFTGDIKDGLSQFIDGDADILITSSCAGTGVDGLQKVCNRLIINSLPWTHAEFEQLKGRIYRQGQIHNSIDVLVPLTYSIINGERWSWCESRWKRIQFKKSIGDAAVDGVVPDGHLRTPAQAYKDAVSWLNRLEKN